MRNISHILAQTNPNSSSKVHLHLVSPPWPLPYLSHRYQRFLSDYNELSGWIKEKTALINADELPTDVAGGEALLDRHQQHKVERKVLSIKRKRETPRILECFLLNVKTFCLITTA